jgi:hypothetical protein
MSDDKDEVGSTQKALMGMMGLGAGIGAMYMLLRGGWGARAKRLFIEEPDVTLDTMVPADEEIGALEREQGRMLLAQLLVELMRQGTTDYNENREKLAEQGVRGPRDVMVPNDMLHRVMFEAWSSGWRQAENKAALGLPPDKRDVVTRGYAYTDAIQAVSKRAKEGDEAKAKIDTIRKLFDERAERKRQAGRGLDESEWELTTAVSEIIDR